jgi:hypothetical protein
MMWRSGVKQTTSVKAIGIKPELNVERSLSRQASCC